MTGQTALAGPIHTNQFICHFAFDHNGSVNALRLSAKIGVESAQDHTGVVSSPVLMKA
jgi:hypothetical protein